HSDYVHILTMSLLSLRPPPRSPLFPYTTLFRSRVPPGELPARALHGVVVRRPATEQRNVARTLRGVGIVLQRLHVGHGEAAAAGDRKSTRLNSSHVKSSYAVFCLKKKITNGVNA